MQCSQKEIILLIKTLVSMYIHYIYLIYIIWIHKKAKALEEPY